MAGFLNTLFGTPDQTQALGLLGVGMMNGGFGKGAGLAMQHLAGADERKKKGLLADLQMQDLQSQIEARKKAAEQAQAKQEFIGRMFGNAATYAPGQLGSGSMGAVPNANPMAPAASGLASITPEQVAMAKALYGIDLLEPWKIAKQGFEQKPGVYRVDPTTGRREYVPNPVDGRTVDATGRVGMMPGATDAITASTMATELPKAILNSAGRINLRENADGTHVPVPELLENPYLQNLMGQLGVPRPAAPVQPAQPQPAQPAPMMGSPNSTMSGTVVPPEAQRGADAEAVRMMRAELQNPNLPVAHKQAIQREIARMEQASAKPGFPAPSAIRNPQGYGQTTEQKIAAKVDEARRLEQAKADVVPTEERRNRGLTADYLFNTLGKAIHHPGRETATGLSGTLDPRNYISGSEATDFQVLLDQIQGSAFLQAFESLKGGGQITEVEGKKAEQAIARLNRAQSDKEFKTALEEFQSIVGAARDRMRGGTKPPEPPGQQPKKTLDALPKIAPKGQRVRDTATGEILMFNGISWVKEK